LDFARALLRLSPPASPTSCFIAIDDQNDWVGPLGGHPLAKTPNMDRLARRGTVMANAHCQAPLCNPSRTSLMLSLRPTTTGIYGLAPWFRSLETWRDRVTLPQHLKAHGYKTLTAGKIYHGGRAGRSSAQRSSTSGGRRAASACGRRRNSFRPTHGKPSADGLGRVSAQG
jgi:arylsulfatase A-like enzyme